MNERNRPQEEEGEFELGGPVIPRWVLAGLELTPDLLQDIAEINQGMYGPGYKLVVKIPEKAAKTPVRRISWRRPDRVISARTLKHARKPYRSIVSEERLRGQACAR